MFRRIFESHDESLTSSSESDSDDLVDQVQGDDPLDMRFGAVADLLEEMEEDWMAREACMHKIGWEMAHSHNVLKGQTEEWWQPPSRSDQETVAEGLRYREHAVILDDPQFAYQVISNAALRRQYFKAEVDELPEDCCFEAIQTLRKRYAFQALYQRSDFLDMVENAILNQSCKDYSEGVDLTRRY